MTGRLKVAGVCGPIAQPPFARDIPFSGVVMDDAEPRRRNQDVTNPNRYVIPDDATGFAEWARANKYDPVTRTYLRDDDECDVVGFHEVHRSGDRLA